MSISLTSLNNPTEKTDCHSCGHGGMQKETLSFEDRGMQNVMCSPPGEQAQSDKIKHGK